MSHKYAITATSTYAGNLLQCYPLWTVHSIYRKTINIQHKDYLLALQAESSPLSPISLIAAMSVEQMSSLAICIGDTVHISKGSSDGSFEIIFPENTIGFICQPDYIYCSHLSCLKADIPADRLLLRMQKAVLYSNTSSNASCFCKIISDYSKPGNSDLVFSASRSCILQCRELFKRENYAKAAKALSGLLGLGIGLTPGGDDFLCGALAGLVLLSQSSHPFASHLALQIKTQLHRTNDISKAFLQCALSHDFSLAVTSLTGLPKSAEILDLFSDIGHTSGIDTLCGIWYILELFAELNGDNVG